jgi:hypothetical protein
MLKSKDRSNLINDNNYESLLNPPAPNQTKYEQILEWAQKELDKENSN